MPQWAGHWKPDQEASACEGCFRSFSLTVRRHHCRDCGGVFCGECTARTAIMAYRGVKQKPERICALCAPFVELYAEVIEGRGSSSSHLEGSERRHFSSEDAGLFFDTSAYEGNFVRPSSVGIRRRTASSDDMAVANFSIVPDLVRTVSGGPRLGSAARGFPTNRQVFPHGDVGSFLALAPGDLSSIATDALTLALRGAIASSSHARDGGPGETAITQVADFASYY